MDEGVCVSTSSLDLTIGGSDGLIRPLLLLLLLVLLEIAVRFGAEAFQHLTPILCHTSPPPPALNTRTQTRTGLATRI